MLSPLTLSLLSELQGKSHSAYSEGGLLYTYIEASNQAHSRFPEITTVASNLHSNELEDLGRFFQASQGDYLAESAAPQFLEVAQRLIGRLQEDLKFDEVSFALEDGGHDMEAKLKMARRSDNRYFELELWWSID